MHNGRGFVETSLYKFKTQGRSAKLRNRLLPVVALSPGVSGLDWASAWLTLQKAEHLEAKKGWPTMPAPAGWYVVGVAFGICRSLDLT